MRASDRNRVRRIRFGQAVLLGVVIEKRPTYGGGVAGIHSMRWYRTMPNTYKGGGYINGPFMTRHEAVDTALKLFGVISSDEFAVPDAPTATIDFCGRRATPHLD